jgi:hypothetical protein
MKIIKIFEFLKKKTNESTKEEEKQDDKDKHGEIGRRCNRFLMMTQEDEEKEQKEN